MKKILALTLVLLMIAAPVFAATGDVYNAADKTLFKEAMDFLSDKTAVARYVSEPEKFLIELDDGKLYNADDIATAFGANPSGYQADLKASGKGIEKPSGQEMKVELKRGAVLEEDFEITGAKVEKDPFLGTTHITFKGSFTLKNKSSDKIIGYSFDKCKSKGNIPKGEQGMISTKQEKDVLKLRYYTIVEPTKVETKFEEANEGKPVGFSFLGTDPFVGLYLSIKAKTSIIVPIKVNQTVVKTEKKVFDVAVLASGEEGDGANGELYTFLSGLEYNGVKLFDNKSFKASKGTAALVAGLSFRASKESRAAGIVPEVKVTVSGVTTGNQLSSLVNTLPEEPATPKRIVINGWAGLNSVYKVIIREGAREVFSGRFETAAANLIDEEGWKALNDKAPKGISFKGDSWIKSPPRVEFGPEFPGVYNLEIVGWY